MIKEFKEFAMRGNVIDLAVAFVIGVAFANIVNSFVNDILMPPIGLLIGGMDFSSFVITLKQASEGVEAVTINYGMFIQILITFLIVTFAVFLLVKGINSLKKKRAEIAEVATPPQPSAQEQLLAEIRDLLKNPKRPI